MFYKAKSPPKKPHPIYTPKLSPSKRALESVQAPRLPQPQPCAGFHTGAVTHSGELISISLRVSRLQAKRLLGASCPVSLPSPRRQGLLPKATRPVCSGSETCTLQPLIRINPQQKSVCVCVRSIQHNGPIGTFIPRGIKIASNIKTVCFHRLQSGLRTHAHFISCFQFTIRFYA